MYAIIIFTDEDKSRIVPIEDIKHYNASMPFNPRKKYLVKFGSDGYYSAQIILVKDTIEELEDYQTKKRLKITNKDLLESASDTESEARGETVSKKHTKLEVGNPISKNVLQKKASNTIMESIISNYEERNKTKSQEKSYENIVVEVEKKNEVNEAEIKIKKLTLQVKALQLQNENITLQNKELTELNIQLQKSVIDQFQKLGKMRIEKEKPEELKVGEENDNQIHLGRGVCLTQTVFNDIWFQSTTGAQFVKNITVAVFGTETLINSSVTGRQSNRIKKEIVKPALDGTKLAAIEDIYRYYLEKKNKNVDIEKEIKSIKTYMRNKISDIIRTIERQNKAYKSGPGVQDEKDKNMDEEEESKDNNEEEKNKIDDEEENDN